jgi:hypothetical protein
MKSFRVFELLRFACFFVGSVVGVEAEGAMNSVERRQLLSGISAWSHHSLSCHLLSLNDVIVLTTLLYC